MTTPLLNQLLDEAVERCHDLAGHAQTAATNGSDVAAEALELVQLVETEGPGVHTDVEKAIEAARGAGSRINAAVETAVAALEAVPARAAQSAADVRALFEALREQVQRLDAARVGLLTGLQSSAQALDQDAKDLEEGVEAYIARVQEAWRPPMIALRQLASSAVELRHHVDDQAKLVRKDVGQLGQVALEACDEFVDGTVRGAQTIANHVTTTVNDALERHNAATAELRAAALDETDAGVPDPNWVGTTGDRLRNEIGYLEPIAGQIEEGLFPPLSQIAAAGERAEQHLETVSQSLARVTDR
jgi:hypothetical protein